MFKVIQFNKNYLAKPALLFWAAISNGVRELKMKYMPFYDSRYVKCHGKKEAKVYLMNEAPGPTEAFYRKPSIGSQGGNIFRALKKANISWAVQFKIFKWPTKILKNYSNPVSKLSDFKSRDNFLKIRSQFIKCSNAYPFWPKSSCDSMDFVNPTSEDVLSHLNLQRIRCEINNNQKVLLICGEFAWLICLGYPISNPSKLENQQLDIELLRIINYRFNSDFEQVWYMGHTRRWSLNQKQNLDVIQSISKYLDW